MPDLFTQKVEGTAWKTKPSWYIVAKNDRTVHPDLERFVAKRMGATTYRSRQQPRAHAVQSRLRDRRDPCRRQSRDIGAARIQLLSVIFYRLGKLLIATPGYTYAEAWATALNRILTSPLLSEEKKTSYWDLASDNRPLAALLSRNWRSNATR